MVQYLLVQCSGGSRFSPTHLDFFGCSGRLGLLLEPLFVLQRRRRRRQRRRRPPAGLRRADDGPGAVYRLHIWPTGAQWLTAGPHWAAASAGGGGGGTRLTLLAVSWLGPRSVRELVMVWSHGRVEGFSSHDGRRRQLLLFQHALVRRSSLLQDEHTGLQVRRDIRALVYD